MKCTTIAITVLLTGTALADSNKAINSDSGKDVWKSSNESREMTKESVRNGIKKDLEFCSSLNCQLDSAMQNLRKERQSQERMLAVCRQNAGLYRAAMLHADKCGVYPTYVQNRYFSREELRAQIRLLMTQAIGHEATIKRLEATTRQSETGYGDMAVLTNYITSIGAAVDADSVLGKIATHEFSGLRRAAKHQSQTVRRLENYQAARPFDEIQRLSDQAWPDAHWIVGDEELDKFLSADSPAEQKMSIKTTRSKSTN